MSVTAVSWLQDAWDQVARCQSTTADESSQPGAAPTSGSTPAPIALPAQQITVFYRWIFAPRRQTSCQCHAMMPFVCGWYDAPAPGQKMQRGSFFFWWVHLVSSKRPKASSMEGPHIPSHDVKAMYSILINCAAIYQNKPRFTIAHFIITPSCKTEENKIHQHPILTTWYAGTKGRCCVWIFWTCWICIDAGAVKQPYCINDVGMFSK